jgi:TM2 domain-containing membrane protein YozV
MLFEVSADGQSHLRAVWHKADNARAVAILLDVSLGLFGAHRMYLGTDLKVPIIYTATVGGACVLWLVDLGLLIFSKDIERYMNNPNVFMWNDKPINENEIGRSNEPADVPSMTD